MCIFKYLKIHILTPVGLILALHCFGQNNVLQFEYIGVEQGLSDNYIEDALQDKYGYVWLATAHGLNRYDGRNCKIYN